MGPLQANHQSGPSLTDVATGQSYQDGSLAEDPPSQAALGCVKLSRKANKDTVECEQLLSVPAFVTSPS